MATQTTQPHHGSIKPISSHVPVTRFPGVAVGIGGVAGFDFGLSSVPYVWSLAGPSAGFSFGGGEGFGVAVSATGTPTGDANVVITAGAASGGFGVAVSDGPTKVISLVCKTP
jgi:hypothetical protein